MTQPIITADEKYADDLIARLWDKITNSHPSGSEKTYILILSSIAFLMVHDYQNIKLGREDSIEDTFDDQHTNFLWFLVDGATDPVLAKLERFIDLFDFTGGETVADLEWPEEYRSGFSNSPTKDPNAEYVRVEQDFSTGPISDIDAEEDADFVREVANLLGKSQPDH